MADLSDLYHALATRGQIERSEVHNTSGSPSSRLSLQTIMACRSVLGAVL